MLDRIEVPLVDIGAVRTGGWFTLGFANSDHFTETTPEKILNSGRVRFAYSVPKIRGMFQQAGFLVTSIRGHRFFIDGMPPEWNSGDMDDADKRDLMQTLADLEIDLARHLPPEYAKHLRCHAIRVRNPEDGLQAFRLEPLEVLDHSLTPLGHLDPGETSQAGRPRPAFKIVLSEFRNAFS